MPPSLAPTTMGPTSRGCTTRMGTAPPTGACGTVPMWPRPRSPHPVSPVSRRDQRAVVACSVAAISSAAAGQIPASAPEPADDGSRLVGRWTGPTNLRALAGDATPEDRAYLDQHLAADRGGNLARIVALLDAVRPGRTRSAAAWRAAVTAELAIPVEFADRIFDLLVRAGWAAASDEEDN